MCEACVELIEHLMRGGTRFYATGSARDVEAGQPMSTSQRLNWFRHRLPRTSAVMDLDRIIRSAEREPAGRA